VSVYLPLSLASAGEAAAADKGQDAGASCGFSRARALPDAQTRGVAQAYCPATHPGAEV
jgi:hypothetical protein